jgi:hypothetical protein
LGRDQEVGAGVETATVVVQRLGPIREELIANATPADLLVRQVADVIHVGGSHVVLGVILVGQGCVVPSVVIVSQAAILRVQWSVCVVE